MMIRKLSTLIAVLLISLLTNAQNVLPGFTVVNKGQARIIVSWANPYGNNIRQLSIQRSFDSVKNYKTILTLPDPTTPQNGYVDTKATNDHMFYRLFILLDSGKYVFSRVQRPAPDTAQSTYTRQAITDRPIDTLELERLKSELSRTGIDRPLIVKKSNLIVGIIPASAFKQFKDSITYNTQDTVVMKTADTILIKSFVAKVYFQPSKYVFTEKDGNIKISLEDAASRKYSLKFFEENDLELFEIKHIKNPYVILDKTNFLHSGWFNFELYEDGKLKEKHKLFVPKDF